MKMMFGLSAAKVGVSAVKSPRLRLARRRRNFMGEMGRSALQDFTHATDLLGRLLRRAAQVLEAIRIGRHGLADFLDWMREEITPHVLVNELALRVLHRRTARHH